jgi:signal transduction histidine kinase
MPDKVSATAWFPTDEPGDCAVCGSTREVLGARALAAAGELALTLAARGQAVSLLEAAVSGLAAALGTGRVSVIVPEAGGFWRVLISSSGSETHDLLIDSLRYPELSEVKRTSAPYLAPDVEAAPELKGAVPFLCSAGVRGLAAFPIFTVTPGSEPVVIKLSLPYVPPPEKVALATLAAHLVVHRLSRMPRAEAAAQLGLPPPPAAGTDPSSLLRLLPVPALVIDEEGRVIHANTRALWFLRGRGQRPADDGLVLGLQPERPWNVHGSRWEAQVPGRGGAMHVLGWSTSIGADRNLVLLEPHPEARRRSFERRIRRTLAEKLRELESANALLEENARSRARFVSDAAHELKTPLAILRSYLDTLNDDLSEGLSVQQREFLQAATHGARRLQRLIDQLLDLAALESGHLPLLLGPVSSKAVVTTVLGELRPLAAGARVLLSGIGEPDLALRADAERLGQVVRNLVENGVKYTNPGGEVSVHVERNDDRGLLRVRDTGVGIPTDSLAHIFEEFVRIPGRQNVEGAGLGLAIVRRLVLAMGGRVWVESAHGSGSSFFVELPLWTGQG